MFERRQCYTKERQLSLPVLSPSESTGTPIISSMDRNKLVIGVSAEYRRCTPPRSCPRCAPPKKPVN